MATKTRPKPAPVEEQIADDEEDLEELDEDDEVEDTPTKKKSKDAVAFGASDLAALLSSKMDKEISAKDLRTLLRKMAREETPRIAREVIPGNKARYSWAGPDDPEVRRIIKAVTGGELEQGKKEALQKLKDTKAAKAAAEGKTAGKAKSKTGKASKPAPVEDDDEAELVEDFDEDE